MRKFLAMMFFCPEDSLGLVLMHFPLGVVNVAIGVLLYMAGFPSVGLVIATLFGYGFIKYEVIERRDLHDLGYQEIKGWLWGMGFTSLLGSIIYLIMR
jgi:hypothetical protein